MDSTRKMNLIEQLNQTLTYVASLKAVNRENKRQPIVSGETGLLDSIFINIRMGRAELRTGSLTGRMGSYPTEAGPIIWIVGRKHGHGRMERGRNQE
jgi:hypothetical protein